MFNFIRNAKLYHSGGTNLLHPHQQCLLESRTLGLQNEPSDVCLNFNISALNPGLVFLSPPPHCVRMDLEQIVYSKESDMNAPSLKPSSFPLQVLGTYTCCHGNITSTHSWNCSIRVPEWAASAALSTLGWDAEQLAFQSLIHQVNRTELYSYY